MNFKRIFRSPLAWIVIAVIAIGLLIDFGQRATSGYKDAPTSQVVATRASERNGIVRRDMRHPFASSGPGLTVRICSRTRASIRSPSVRS